MYDYIVWKITETESELLSQLEHPEYFAQKVANLKSGSRRKLEVLAVRRALKELFYGEEQRVAYTADGAPYLLDRSEHISISHTDGYAACITSAEAKVGIDIERIGKRVERVVSHFLKPEELVAIEASSSGSLSDVSGNPLPPSRGTEGVLLPLHLAWSAKETAFKVLGKEYYDLQRLTSVLRIDYEAKTLLLGVEGREKPLQIHFDYTDDYVLTFVELTD